MPISQKNSLEHFLTDPLIKLLPEFRPISIAEMEIRRFFVEAPEFEVDFQFAVEREYGQIKRHKMPLFVADHEYADSNLERAATAIKSALWMYGGHTVYMDGPRELHAEVSSLFQKGNRFGFDSNFMENKVYGREFRIKSVPSNDLPPENEQLFNLNRELAGRIVAFDIGASDVKTAAYENGKLMYSHETPWNPIVEKESDFFRNFMIKVITETATHLSGSVQGIGGSTAGVIVNNQVMVGSWLRGAEKAGNLAEAGKLFKYLGEHFNAPIRVLNDGPVAAKAGQLYLTETIGRDKIGGVLGLAFGSSVAAGSIDKLGNVTSRLEEGAFIPVGYSHKAAPLENIFKKVPQDEWSGQYAYAAGYLAQVAVNFLIPRAGFTEKEIDPNLAVPNKLEAVQNYLAKGDPRAHKLFSTIGQSCGYSIPTYMDYCSPGISHVVLFGRVVSKGAQEIIEQNANNILSTRFPGVAEKVKIIVPKDDDVVRKGQAAAAARLVNIN